MTEDPMKARKVKVEGPHEDMVMEPGVALTHRFDAEHQFILRFFANDPVGYLEREKRRRNNFNDIKDSDEKINGPIVIDWVMTSFLEVVEELEDECFTEGDEEKTLEKILGIATSPLLQRYFQNRNNSEICLEVMLTLLRQLDFTYEDVETWLIIRDPDLTRIPEWDEILGEVEKEEKTASAKFEERKLIPILRKVYGKT